MLSVQLLWIPKGHVVTELSNEAVIGEMERQLGRKLTTDEIRFLWLAEAAKKAIEPKIEEPKRNFRKSTA